MFLPRVFASGSASRFASVFALSFASSFAWCWPLLPRVVLRNLRFYLEFCFRFCLKFVDFASLRHRVCNVFASLARASFLHSFCLAMRPHPPTSLSLGEWRYRQPVSQSRLVQETTTTPSPQMLGPRPWIW